VAAALARSVRVGLRVAPALAWSVRAGSWSVRGGCAGSVRSSFAAEGPMERLGFAACWRRARRVGSGAVAPWPQLPLGRADAAELRRRRAGVPALWGSPAADRAHREPAGDPPNPGSPGPTDRRTGRARGPVTTASASGRRRGRGVAVCSGTYAFTASSVRPGYRRTLSGHRALGMSARAAASEPAGERCFCVPESIGPRR
jgi:hypothetical protein